MARHPRFGPYRVMDHVATTAEGTVYRGYDADRTLAEVLMVCTPAAGVPAGWDERVDRLAPDLVITTGSTEGRRWVVLPADRAQTAAELIGLPHPPVQNRLAAAWGWPHLYARTPAQLGVRVACTIGGAAVLAWLVQLIIALVR